MVGVATQSPPPGMTAKSGQSDTPTRNNKNTEVRHGAMETALNRTGGNSSKGINHNTTSTVSMFPSSSLKEDLAIRKCTGKGISIITNKTAF